MQSFQLSLPKNRTVSGAHSIPQNPPPDSLIDYRPLIVALHGGCYDHQYFDAHPKYSASVASQAFQAPFITIDRPSYGGTSSILPIPEDSDFTTESALVMHQSILPKLWDEFGLPSGCKCVVLLCHSLGVMIGVATAAMHGRDETPMYPLGGVIASGMGNVFAVSGGPTHSYDPVDEEHIRMDVGVKDTVMFRPGTVAPEMLDESERLNAAAPVAEIDGFATTWMPVWKEKWAAAVKVPVMFSLVEDDPFFTATSAEMAQCVQAFTSSRRVDGSLMNGAPHCVELSHWSQGWYARCFGFALECAASFALQNPRISSK